jgi:hypothetical protein
MEPEFSASSSSSASSPIVRSEPSVALLQIKEDVLITRGRHPFFLESSSGSGSNHGLPLSAANTPTSLSYNYNAHTSLTTASNVITSDEQLLEVYEDFISFHRSDSCTESLLQLKQYVIEHGIPEQDPSNGGIGYGADTLRTKIWKLLLGVPIHFDTDSYIRKSEVNPTYAFHRFPLSSHQINLTVSCHRSRVSMSRRSKTTDFEHSVTMRSFGREQTKKLFFAFLKSYL